MKFTRVLTIVLLIVLIAGSVSAFDGMRKGFVLGGGLGMAPVVRASAFDIDDSEAGLGLNLFLGYAWDEFNMLVYEGNMAGREESGISVVQGFDGAAWYHYFGPQGKSFFTVVGLGFEYYEIEDLDANDRGGAYLIGGGYEFTRHVQVALYFSGGKTTFNFFGADVDMGHNHLSISINAVAF